MTQDRVFIIWAREVKLSEFMARSLGARVVLSYKPTIFGFRTPIIIRYIWQSIDTFVKLLALKPKTIFVQNPPIFAVFVVWLYSLVSGSRFIIDTHTAGFLDRKWKAFHFLHRFLAKRAALNTVHNYKNLEILISWQVKNGYVLQFYNPSREELINSKVRLEGELQTSLSGHSGPKVFMVNRFANDDAWQEVFETAKIMPKSQFFVTGDYKKIKEPAQKPDNVVFTGYLPHDKFIALMEECDVVLALTKRKDTVLWSIREIMAVGKPFVTSDTEVLRHYFEDVAIFTDHRPEDLKEKIEKAMRDRTIKEKIFSFLETDKKRWEKDIAFIENYI